MIPSIKKFWGKILALWARFVLWFKRFFGRKQRVWGTYRKYPYLPDDFNFAHDVFGIRRNIDRSTGKITGTFWPRYAKNQ